MITQLKDILLAKTNSSSILSIELIQNLWGGYGSLNRVTLDTQSVIVKLIKFPKEQDHPRGWNSDIAHHRKVKSYKVETYWYQNYNDRLDLAYSPRFIDSGEVDNSKYLVLEDLQNLDFIPKEKIQWGEAQLCLKWLANFHAKNLMDVPSNLWSIGTYWHLETRPDELKALGDQKLKEAASKIDTKLNSAKFKTFVHGDAKIANFLFKENSVAAVDFQYVGGGVGIKDVAYFLSSIYNEEELEQGESKYLDYYFNEFALALDLFGKGGIIKEVESEWRSLYAYAWCDFYRFLKGWSPGHWKINSYLEKMKKKVVL